MRHDWETIVVLDDHTITVDGVVCEEAEEIDCCQGCYLHNAMQNGRQEVCDPVPCIARQRNDERNVIFVARHEQPHH